MLKAASTSICKQLNEEEGPLLDTEDQEMMPIFKETSSEMQYELRKTEIAKIYTEVSTGEKKSLQQYHNFT